MHIANFTDDAHTRNVRPPYFEDMFCSLFQVDVMHQNVFELIHKEDRVDFQDQLALKPLSPEDPEKAQLSGTLSLLSELVV